VGEVVDALDKGTNGKRHFDCDGGVVLLLAIKVVLVVVEGLVLA